MSEVYLIPESAPLHRHRLGALTSLGRHPENTIEVADRSVSKFHAQIQRTPDGNHLLQDLGSRNGTYVAGQRIERHLLGHGDEVVLGTVGYRFHAERPITMLTGALRITDQLRQSGKAGVTMIAPALPGGRPIVSLTEAESSIEHSSSFEVSKLRFLPSDQVKDNEQLRQDYDKLRIAHELSSVIRFDADLDAMLQAVVSRIFDLLPADRCAILIMQPDGTTLEPRMVMERSGNVPLDAMPLSQTVLNEVISQKKAVLSTDAITDGRFQASASIVALSIRSAMCVPLVSEESIFGIMHVDSRLRSDAFGPKDLQLFSAIANQTAAALKNASLVQEIQRESETRARLGRLLSPNLVEEVVAGKLDLTRGGARREATVMFTDIRGFTSLSEQLDAESVTALLNEYFEVMVDEVFSAGGTLDKYLGDGMMALFGVPKEQPDSAAAAVACGLQMQVALRSLNRIRQSRGDPAIEMGIGINHGEVIWGALGSRKTMDYTVIGDVVNVASRICSAAQPGQLLITEEMRVRLPRGRFSVTALPPATLKGKAEAVRVFSVTAEPG